MGKLQKLYVPIVLLGASRVGTFVGMFSTEIIIKREAIAV